jgi:hypothetical protein
MSNPTIVTDQHGVSWTLDLHNNTKAMTDPQTGRLVTMDLGISDVHVDAALANYAAGYRSAADMLIADQAVPILPVEKNSNKYFTWDKNDVFQPVQSLEVASGGAVAEVGPRLSSASYNTVNYAVGSFVATEIQANADSALNPERQAVARCLDAIKLAREVRCANLLTSSANWSGGYTATILAGAKWNGGASSNPIQDLFTAIESSATQVTSIVMSELVYHDFIQNAQVQKYIAAKAALPPLPGSDTFGAILNLPPILVGHRKQLATATTLNYVWGNNVALITADAGIPTGGATISTARTFRWTGAIGNTGDSAMEGGFQVRSYFDPKRGGRGGKMVVVTHNDTEVMTSVLAGGLIISAHQ